MLERLSVRLLILQNVFSVGGVCVKQHSGPLERKQNQIHFSDGHKNTVLGQNYFQQQLF